MRSRSQAMISGSMSMGSSKDSGGSPMRVSIRVCAFTCSPVRSGQGVSSIASQVRSTICSRHGRDVGSEPLLVFASRLMSVRCRCRISRPSCSLISRVSVSMRLGRIVPVSRVSSSAVRSAMIFSAVPSKRMRSILTCRIIVHMQILLRASNGSFGSIASDAQNRGISTSSSVPSSHSIGSYSRNYHRADIAYRFLAALHRVRIGCARSSSCVKDSSMIIGTSMFTM